jgi:hypothetical protein
MSKAESAELILKLYDLRREEKMREARNWFLSFFPESMDDVMKALVATETSASYRMVSSYWDMATSFVNHGAIDAEMFAESSNEAIVVFSKIQPFLPQVREKMGNPNYLKNLETFIMKMPDAENVLATRREMMKRMFEARAQMAHNS